MFTCSQMNRPASEVRSRSNFFALALLSLAGMALPVALAGVCLPAQAQTGEWAWMGGSKTVPATCPGGDSIGCGRPGIYGTRGVPAPGNAPGSRFWAMTWTDPAGHFWLFGGIGYNADNEYGDLNDLWEYAPSTREWTWISGGKTGGATVFGTLGKASLENTPGTRYSGTTWTDREGHLWLFGGNGGGDLKELWEFNPSTREWTWWGGNETGLQRGFYGTRGVASPGNIPGARDSGAGWVDREGNLWLFGGYGRDANGHLGWMNDLWKFDIASREWSWMAGSNVLGWIPWVEGDPVGVLGTFGTEGDFAAANSPGSRTGAASWTDEKGDFWLFGGYGCDDGPDQVIVPLNDLWEFDPSLGKWAWMGGDEAGGQSGAYGILGVPSAQNLPGARWDQASWKGLQGEFWLFGGTSGVDLLMLNDLWKFDPSTKEWTWVDGSNGGGQIGVYGKLGLPAPGDIPGARMGAASWTDTRGNFWLFGGQAYDPANYVRAGIMNGLWVYQPVVGKLPAAAPAFSLATGSYKGSQRLTITDTTPGAAVYYTLDGANPTNRSRRYLAPISISASATVKAIAEESDFAESAMTTAEFTIVKAETAP